MVTGLDFWLVNAKYNFFKQFLKILNHIVTQYVHHTSLGNWSDFMYFIDVRTLGSQCVHSTLWLNLLNTSEVDWTISSKHVAYITTLYSKTVVLTYTIWYHNTFTSKSNKEKKEMQFCAIYRAWTEFFFSVREWGIATRCSGVPRGEWGVQIPPPEILKALQNRAKLSTRLWKLLKIAEFRTPTP